MLLIALNDVSENSQNNLLHSKALRTVSLDALLCDPNVLVSALECYLSVVIVHELTDLDVREQEFDSDCTSVHRCADKGLRPCGRCCCTRLTDSLQGCLLGKRGV